MAHILITGGAGFIGSHLAEALLAKGHHVEAVDDLSTGSVRNLDAIRHHQRFSLQVGAVDWEHSALIAELIDRADLVFHLAAAVGVELVVRSPVRTIEINVSGTEVVLSHAAKKGKLVVVASTSEVYGKSSVFPFREDHDLVIGPTTHGRWAYACSKALDEFLALAYAKERGLPVIVTRFFNTVGPRQTGRYGMVVPRFVRQALSGGPITVYGDGEQSRCFCDVEDVVRALLGLIETPKAHGQVFNIGAVEEVSINTLARRVIERVGGDLAITHVPYEEAYEAGFEDMPRRVPDTGRIHALLGWQPRHGLDQILDRIIAWERAHPSA